MVAKATKMSSEAALGAVLGKRAPKTKRGRRILARREPQIVEEPKAALVIRGNKCCPEVLGLLRDLHNIRAPLATLFSRKHPEHPFEEISHVEQLCKKTENNLFVFGSSSKKRPFRLIFGRMFDDKLLDMLEYGVKDYKPASSFRGLVSEATRGSKPLVIFQGSAFETNERLKRTKSLLLDYFGAGRPNNMLLTGIDHVVVCSTYDVPKAPGAPDADKDPEVSVRRFRLSLKKSGSTLPRSELTEIGPSFNLQVDREKGPDKDMWKAAIKVPKAAKPSKTKNVSKDEMGKRRGKVHLGKQEFDQIHTVHHGQAKRKKMAADKAAAQAKKPKTSADDA